MIEQRDPIDGINTLNDLATYVQQLRETLQRDPDSWENLSLDDYLESMSAWLTDTSVSPELESADLAKSLRFFARILRASSAYE